MNGKKLLKCHLKGKASKKLTNGQNIDYSEKRKQPKGFICPFTGVKYHNIQTCLLVYAADSGERLQDHWSSGIVTIIQKLRIFILEIFDKFTEYTEGLAGGMESKSQSVVEKPHKPLIDRCRPIAQQCRELLLEGLGDKVVREIFNKSKPLKKQCVLLLHDLVQHGEVSSEKLQ